MKKHHIIFPLLFVSLIACNNAHDEKNEDHAMDTTNVESAMPDSVTAANTGTTAYVCSCDHKCKTNDECVEKCGDGCGGLH